MSWSTPLTALPHLSDEAVAAFADGVLSGSARARAQSHMSGCAECSEAVVGQRAARAALRSALTPSLPSGLLERLRELPSTAELPPSHIAAALSADGQPLFAAFGASEAHRDDLIPPTVPGFGPGPSDRMSLGRTVLGGSAANRSRSDEAGPGRSGSAPSLARTSGARAAIGPAPLARPAFGGTAFAGAALDDASLVGAALGGAALGGAAFDAPVPVKVPASRPTHHAPPRPTPPAVSRRWASSRVGLGTAAAAALAVGVLASTAATAGGVTPAGSERPSIRSVSPAAPAGVTVPGQRGSQMDVVSFFSNPAK